MEKLNRPRVLVFDVETAPIIASVWKIFDENIGLNQIDLDWHLLSWAAKWLGDPVAKVMYQDQRKAKDITDDLPLLKNIWKLLDQADIVITQNGNSFDIKKLNARFIIKGLKPPSSYKCIDTLLIAKQRFKFTSNKLEYMTDKLCTKYKKLKHKKFPGFELWSECLKGNLDAWKEMEKYNKHDVLSLEELYTTLSPWYTGACLNSYSDDGKNTCNCGSDNIKKNGFYFTNTGKFQRYRCLDCGAESRESKNLLQHKVRRRVY